MEMFGFTSIPTIAIIVYELANFVKHKKLFPNKYLPEFCGATGAVISITCYFMKIPWLGANDIFTAIAVGIASGFTAVGANQVIKQKQKGE